MRLALCRSYVMAVVAGLLLVAAAKAGGDAAVSKASSLIQKDQRLIALVAHPTAKLKSIEYQSTTKLANGFQLNYRLNFVSAFGNPFYSTLGFEFDSDGNIRDITMVATSALVDPFSASDLALDALRDDILDNSPDIRNNRAAREYIERADAKGILVFLLKNTR